MTFSEDSDLLKKRPGILNQGVDSFKDQQIEAARIRDIDFELNPMDESRFSDADIEIKPAAVLLAMSLAYDLLAKDAASEEDSLAAQREHYRMEFEREWEATRRAGFSYYWDASGEVETDDKIPLAGSGTARRESVDSNVCLWSPYPRPGENRRLPGETQKSQGVRQNSPSSPQGVCRCNLPGNGDIPCADDRRGRKNGR